MALSRDNGKQGNENLMLLFNQLTIKGFRQWKAFTDILVISQAPKEDLVTGHTANSVGYEGMKNYLICCKMTKL